MCPLYRGQCASVGGSGAHFRGVRCQHRGVRCPFIEGQLLPKNILSGNASCCGRLAWRPPRVGGLLTPLTKHWAATRSMVADAHGAAAVGQPLVKDEPSDAGVAAGGAAGGVGGADGLDLSRFDELVRVYTEPYDAACTAGLHTCSLLSST